MSVICIPNTQGCTLEYSERTRSVADILRRRDPFALISDLSTNADEYDAEARLITAQLAHASDAAQLTAIVWQVFERQFGPDMAGAPVEWESIAAEIWAATQPPSRV